MNLTYSMSLTYSEARAILRQSNEHSSRRSRVDHVWRSCKPLPKGARERLSEHLMKMYIEGEKDEHRLTVEGLSYLHNLHQDIDSRN
jgi:hypothetical protein